MNLRKNLRYLLRGVHRDRGLPILDPEAQRARAVVLHVGLPEQVARAADRNGEVDWSILAAAMDTLFMSTGSTLGVRRFWISPQDSLGGRTPIDVLPLKGGPQKVEEAAYRASAQAAAVRAAS